MSGLGDATVKMGLFWSTEGNLAELEFSRSINYPLGSIERAMRFQLEVCEGC